MPAVLERFVIAAARACGAAVAAIPFAVVGVLVAVAAGAVGRAESYGIFAVLPGTLLIAIVSTALGSLIGIGAAIAAEELTGGAMRTAVHGAINLLGSIPAVCYGWFGAAIVVPALRLPAGAGVEASIGVCLILSMMIAPTVSALAAGALSSVPARIRLAAHASGATRLQTAWLVVVPAVRSRLAAASAAGIARSIAEATAVLIIANAALDGTSSGTTIASALLARAADSMRVGVMPALAAAALVLVVVTLLSTYVTSRGERTGRWA